MAILERALASARQVPIDRVIDELGEDIKVEEVSEAMAGQVILDIRHPDAAEDEPSNCPASKFRPCRSTR